MKPILLAGLFLFLAINIQCQVIGKTTLNDLLSEINVSEDVEKHDILYKSGGQVLKVLYKNSHRREFCFYNDLLFCTKIWDPKESAQEKFQKLKDDKVITPDGNAWIVKGVEYTLALVSTDDFGRQWLVYLGIPKVNKE